MDVLIMNIIHIMKNKSIKLSQNRMKEKRMLNKYEKDLLEFRIDQLETILKSLKKILNAEIR